MWRLFVLPLCFRRTEAKPLVYDSQHQSPESGFWKRGFNGTAQTIGCADTGLHQDLCWFDRKIGSYDAIRDGDTLGDSHGDAVVSLLVGEREENRGVAFGATVAFLDLAEGSGAPATTALFEQTVYQRLYDRGARILTFSQTRSAERCGRFSCGPYDRSEMAADQFLRAHPDALILYSAGNNAEEQSPNIGSPARAKNVVSVGALGSRGRGLASFSSTGPLRDGRTKPEVVFVGGGVRVGALSPTGSCSERRVSGTSFAAPSVAGVAALLREEVLSTDRAVSGAMIKALLIQSAAMWGQAEGAGYGYGEVTMRNAAKVVRNSLRYEGVVSGPFRENVYVLRPSRNASTFPEHAFRATLVWMDWPSSVNPSTPLVHDLDLSLSYRVANGTKRTLDRLADHVNTVERITAFSMPVGVTELRVTVRLARFYWFSLVSEPRQPYALIVGEERSSASHWELVNVERSEEPATHRTGPWLVCIGLMLSNTTIWVVWWRVLKGHLGWFAMNGGILILLGYLYLACQYWLFTALVSSPLLSMLCIRGATGRETTPLLVFDGLLECGVLVAVAAALARVFQTPSMRLALYVGTPLVSVVLTCRPRLRRYKQGPELPDVGREEGQELQELPDVGREEGCAV